MEEKSTTELIQKGNEAEEIVCYKLIEATTKKIEKALNDTDCA